MKTNINHRRVSLSACIALMLLLMAGYSTLAAETITWDFETGTDGWRPRLQTIGLSRATGVTVEDAGNGSLKIQGSFGKEGVIAESDLRPLAGFQKYRLSARLHYEKIVPTENLSTSHVPIPYPRVEFHISDDDTGLGSASTEESWPGVVIIGPKSGWIDLTAEFRPPRGTKLCRIVILSMHDYRVPEQQYNGTFYIDDVKIEPIDAFTGAERYALEKPPSRLGVHPRLYLTKERIAELRSKIGTTHAPLWRELKEQADRLLASGPPEYRGNDEGIWDEQWWQANNGPSMINLAMTYLISGERKYLDAAREWALATCRYPGWGVGWADGIDCMTGHNLYGLAVVYDWCYSDLDEETRTVIRETLVRRASHLFKKAAGGTIVPTAEDFRERPWPEWEEAWLQNHLWVNSCGLAAAGLALYDETDEARLWTGFALDRFRRTMEYLGPDGASHEGINYWSYGLEHLLKFMYLARDLLDEDMFDHDWFRNAARYRLYMSLPRNAWTRGNIAVDYGDSRRMDHSGPDHMLRLLASVYRDPNAQGLARELDEANVLNAGNRWLNLVWYDPLVDEKSPDGLPTMHNFNDMGIVTARSGWTGDESFVFYKCGPYIGRTAIETMNYCISSGHHTHPDQNHVSLFAGGEWLLRDDGWFGKYTAQHNTLVIDGGEQLGGGESIFDGAVLHALRREPRIVTAQSTPAFDHIAGDAAPAYPPETGLVRYVRHLLYLKPDVLIVADDIELDTARDLDLFFHPECQEAARDDGTFILRGGKAVLRLDPLTPEGVESTAENQTFVDRRYNKEEFLAIRLGTHGKRWRNAVALTWSEAKSVPERVKLTGKGNRWTFECESGTVVLDWLSGAAEYSR